MAKFLRSQTENPCNNPRRTDPLIELVYGFRDTPKLNHKQEADRKLAMVLRPQKKRRRKRKLQRKLPLLMSLESGDGREGR
mmetsp:Transcript_40609/g.65888  ORF Transcript_40609/g.65888 Transcript_40609/m.65888 type:complete len:81 (+) Transcript_40609:303-545(+)